MNRKSLRPNELRPRPGAILDASAQAPLERPRRPALADRLADPVAIAALRVHAHGLAPGARGEGDAAEADPPRGRRRDG